MNTQMYELVKQAMKDGKTAEDLAVEFGAMTVAAQKELEAKKTVYEDMTDLEFIKLAQKNVVDMTGFVKEGVLANLIGIWLCQHGVIPDRVCKTKAEFSSNLKSALHLVLTLFDTTGRIADKMKTPRWRIDDNDMAKMKDDFIKFFTTVVPPPERK